MIVDAKDSYSDYDYFAEVNGIGNYMDPGDRLIDYVWIDWKLQILAISA